jgi:Skp family chaperone for outer membrane proteins
MMRLCVAVLCIVLVFHCDAAAQDKKAAVENFRRIMNEYKISSKKQYHKVSSY